MSEYKKERIPGYESNLFAASSNPDNQYQGNKTAFLELPKCATLSAICYLIYEIKVILSTRYGFTEVKTASVDHLVVSVNFEAQPLTFESL